VFILSPFIVFTSNNQSVSAISISNSYGRLVAQMENYHSYSSYIRYVDIFSDLSRNMTSSSSDLSEEDNTIPTEEIGQDDINTEEDLGDESTVDTNQSSSSSP
jgi:hypothetical protein